MKRKVQMILKKVVAVVLLAGTFGFTGLTVEAKCADAMEGTVDIEVLEAKVVEGTEKYMEVVPYTTLANCHINVVSDSEGMHIGISTGVFGTASVLGVKDVKVQKKNWLGFWETVATSSGGEASDCSTMSVNILYRNAEKDATYRILCIHYGDVDGYHEMEHDSGSFVHTY